jgi:hypothetical protein
MLIETTAHRHSGNCSPAYSLTTRFTSSAVMSDPLFPFGQKNKVLFISALLVLVFIAGIIRAIWLLLARL